VGVGFISLLFGSRITIIIINLGYCYSQWPYALGAFGALACWHPLWLGRSAYLLVCFCSGCLRIGRQNGLSPRTPSQNQMPESFRIHPWMKRTPTQSRSGGCRTFLASLEDLGILRRRPCRRRFEVFQRLHRLCMERLEGDADEWRDIADPWGNLTMTKTIHIIREGEKKKPGLQWKGD